MKKGLAVFLIFMMLTNTTAWAQKNTEMTAFEKKVVAEMPEHHYTVVLQEGVAKRKTYHMNSDVDEAILAAEPYINQDGVMMVAAEDLGEFLGWGKERNEIYIQDGKLVNVKVENLVEWNEESQKIKIEVPWRIAGYCAPVYGEEMWIPYQEGDFVEAWEPVIQGYDGQLRKHKKYDIEMTVGTNVWSFNGYRYVSRTKSEWKDGRVYLPLKDIQETLQPDTMYYWDGETRTLAMVRGYWE